MDIERRVATTNDDFRVFLDANGLAYKKDSNLVILKIMESNPKWPIVEEYIACNSIFSQATPRYTKAEMNNASWFAVRSKWRWEYPMPDSDGSYKQVVYNTDSHCEECGTGLIQKDLFRLRKSPNWGTKHFLMLNWVEDELFVSEKAKNILSGSELKGFEFLEVLRYKKDTVLDGIFQLKVLNTLMPGFIPVEKYIKKHLLCECCDSSKWILSGKGCAFDKQIFPEDIDIAKSYEGFGFGHTAPKMIFVSQKFYRLIIDNKLDKNLEFIPIDLKG